MICIDIRTSKAIEIMQYEIKVIYLLLVKDIAFLQREYTVIKNLLYIKT